MFLKTGVKLTSSFADVEFGAFSAMDDVGLHMLYVRQLPKCLVMSFCDLGPWILVAVQMNGHVLHLGVLQGVVPGSLVVGCRSSDCTSISRMLVGVTFVCDQWWLVKDLSHLGTYFCLVLIK